MFLLCWPKVNYLNIPSQVIFLVWQKSMNVYMHTDSGKNKNFLLASPAHRIIRNPWFELEAGVVEISDFPPSACTDTSFLQCMWMNSLITWVTWFLWLTWLHVCLKTHWGVNYRITMTNGLFINWFLCRRSSRRCGKNYKKSRRKLLEVRLLFGKKMSNIIASM